MISMGYIGILFALVIYVDERRMKVTYYMNKTKQCEVCKEFTWNEDFTKEGICRYCDETDKTMERKLRLYKIKIKIRQQVAKAFKGHRYGENSIPHKMIGLLPDELRKHLWNTFVERYHREPVKEDVLHVDHIIPLSRGRSEWEIKKLNHYTNLQWLLRDDNFRKNDKFKLD